MEAAAYPTDRISFERLRAPLWSRPVRARRRKVWQRSNSARPTDEAISER